MTNGQLCRPSLKLVVTNALKIEAAVSFNKMISAD